jgi:S-adenosylmethionine decarboxylase
MIRRHVIADFWVEDDAILRVQEPLRSAVREGIRESGATALGERFHQFQPSGFSGCFLLAESHVALHTFVEERLLALDVFTCGEADVDRILDAVRRALRPVQEHVRRVRRG